ncbi:MAG: ABC transporter ATP-binding protein [Sphingorhabdus sp.]
MVQPILEISNLSKTYAGGHQALSEINLKIAKGEIFGLLGPNGAGKTTLINIICGIVKPGQGSLCVAGLDVVRDFRAVRQMIGLVPQELHTDAFEKVIATVNFSRGLFGKRPDPVFIEQLLRDLSLWDKRNSTIAELSGGMKRRVMIAKALSHEPELLFLDEPTAGVDVELRRDMWAMVRRLRDRGVTVILTTHYIEEAEDMADRIGVITEGRLIIVEEKSVLMQKMGHKTLTLNLSEPLTAIPDGLNKWPLKLEADGHKLVYEFNTQAETTGVPSLLRQMSDLGLQFKDLNTRQSSLEDIFVGLVSRGEDRA